MARTTGQLSLMQRSKLLSMPTTRVHWHRRRNGESLFSPMPIRRWSITYRFSIAWVARTKKIVVSYPYEGFDFGSISMRAVLFGGPAKN